MGVEFSNQEFNSETFNSKLVVKSDRIRNLRKLDNFLLALSELSDIDSIMDLIEKKDLMLDFFTNSFREDKTSHFFNEKEHSIDYSLTQVVELLGVP